MNILPLENIRTEQLLDSVHSIFPILIHWNRLSLENILYIISLHDQGIFPIPLMKMINCEYLSDI